MKFAYYPGCCPQTTTRELDVSTRKIAMRLGIDLVDLNEPACCGSVELRLNDPDLFYATNGRTLAMAEGQGLDLLTVCNTCELTLAQANKNLKEDHELLNKTNKVLSRVHLKYSGGVDVKHLLWILLTDVGPAKIKKEIQKPLTGLKVAPFYGCHILRPKEILGFDDPDNPRSLEDFIQLCGAEPVDYPGKIKCCGAHIHGYKPELALNMTGKYLKQARDAGAQCMVTPCPLCFCMLDGHQKQANKKLGSHFNLPVFHLPQLLGLAMGLGEGGLMLKRHMVSAHELLCQIGLV